MRPGIYRHYKGPLYRVLGLVAHHETRRPWVLYVSLSHGSVNIRPLKRMSMSFGEEKDAWDEKVKLEHGDQSILVDRFVYVGEEIP